MDPLNENYHHKQKLLRSDDRFFKARNILNIIFMVGAVVGLIVFFTVSHFIGTIIILASMVFKIVECILRFIH